jgi:hypothetical protein
MNHLKAFAPHHEAALLLLLLRLRKMKLFPQ